MLTTTLEIIRVLLKGDPTETPAQRARKLAILRDDGVPESKPESAPLNTGPKIIRRKQAAAQYGCSLRLIDRLAQQGLLKKVRLPGRTRAAGFLESDINALLTGKGMV